MSTTVGSKAVAELIDDFGGDVLAPGDRAFPEVAGVFNARAADVAPAAVARCRDVDDVLVLARWSRDHHLPLAVRGGGHGTDGYAAASGSVVADLSLMRNVSVDADARTVRASPGALLGDLDSATQQHGLVVPSGTNSRTGVVGLTLGGGVGHLMRRFGATVDNVLGLDVVTTDGHLVRADASTNPDLYWALRGGGGNFGIVTAFDYRAHRLDHDVTSGQIVFDGPQVATVLTRVEEYMRDAPRELSLLATLARVAPDPSSTGAAGATIVILTPVHSGAPEGAEPLIDGIAALGAPSADSMRRRSWVETNSLLDDVAPPDKRLAQRGGYLAELSPDVVRAATDGLEPAPANAQSLHILNFYRMGGAISDDVAEATTAFSRTGATWLWESVAAWDTPHEDHANDRWSDDLRARLAPFTLSNGYTNLTEDLGPRWRRHVHGDDAKYARLAEVKATWDPQNRLPHNKNIEPSARQGLSRGVAV